MRRALGLLGEAPRHRPEQDRPEPSHRGNDRFGGGGLHRRRFVQDGDIPVTVLRRDQSHDAPAYRANSPSVPPTTSRLQRTEAALAAETAAREKAERSLADSQAVVHDLQTKIGHADLAKHEAVEALRLERETLSQLRADSYALQQRLQEALEQARTWEQAASLAHEQLSEERQARKAAEKALRSAEAARDEAEQLARAISEDATTSRRHEPEAISPPRSRDGAPRPRAEPEVLATVSRRPRGQDVSAAEPEPVKWWLNPKPAAKRR